MSSTFGPTKTATVNGTTLAYREVGHGQPVVFVRRLPIGQNGGCQDGRSRGLVRGRCVFRRHIGGRLGLWGRGWATGDNCEQSER